MGSFLLTAFALCLIAACVWLWLHAGREATGGQGAYVQDELRWMPAEIAAGELLSSEHQLYATLDGQTVPVRPDQVYLTPDRMIVPVETKTRRQAATFGYDIIELSMQRLALQESHAHAGRGQVAMHGFVRIKDKTGRRRPRYLRVELWDRPRLEALHRRYRGILAGDIEPASQTNRAACRGCAYRTRCPAAL